MAERKKIKNIRQIWNGKKLLINNFTNLDLEGLDLSHIPQKAWKRCIFYNTNLKRTGIKLNPSLIKPTYGKYGNGRYMRNCDLSENDFSYLKKYEVEGVIFDGSTFENSTFTTYLPCSLKDVILPKNYHDFDYDDNFGDIDVDTIRKNPNLKYSSYQIMRCIKIYVREKIKANDDNDIKYKETLANECIELLAFDKQGYIIKFYNLLKNDMSLDDKINFFGGYVINKYLKDISIDIPIEILNLFTFKGTTFDNVSINNHLEDLLKLHEYFIYGEPKNEIKLLRLPSIKYDSWKYKEWYQRKISNSPVSFLTKVYIELSRICNGHCEFCRNSSFEDCKYNLQKINETLNTIEHYLNIIVIGGGEPTLRLDDVKYLYENFKHTYNQIVWRMFTNGSNPNFVDDSYIMNHFDINLSRHAVDDAENAKIFNLNPIDMMKTNDIIKLVNKKPNTILSATCFKGGLDTFEKVIDYIKYAENIGCMKVLLTNLNNDFSMGDKSVYPYDLSIDNDIFLKAIDYLKSKGYKSEYPIYGTGGYVAFVLTNDDGFSVTIQSYITKEELDTNWEVAIKRTFDLSIDPAGNLYENWHQQSGIVKSMGKR